MSKEAIDRNYAAKHLETGEDKARARLGRPKSWNGLVNAIKAGGAPANFLNPAERAQDQPYRDPFAESFGG